MDSTLSVPNEEELAIITEYIHEYVLDDEELNAEQFIVAKKADKIVGFGRLRKHPECTELCSLGIVSADRGSGIGGEIVKKLLEVGPPEIYVVCIIPDFFEKYGFRLTETFPESIKRKHHICTTEYVVEEPYVVMKKGNSE